jgi:hypothetical protein
MSEAGQSERGWQPIYAHLWFVAHLLLFCFAYTAWRRISQLSEGAPSAFPKYMSVMPPSV